MAVSANIKSLPGLIATGDQSAKQFYWMKVSSTGGSVKVVAATTDVALGILQNKPEASEEALVQVEGLSKVIAGTSVGWTEGIAVGWNTTGKAVPIAANGTNDNRLVGARFLSAYNQTTTITLNQIISVQLFGAAQRL